jgi:nicotinamidase/pyrazinamidase
LIGSDGRVIGGSAGQVNEFVVQKGCRTLFDSYSPFKDDGGEETGLKQFLHSKGIKNLVCFGLATDFCVHAAVTDGVREGFSVFCVKDLCRGLDKAYDWALYEKAGVTLLSLEQAKKACTAM